MKNRFARLAVGLTLLAGACSNSEPETLPTLDLTTTTAEPTTTEAPTTTAPSSTTSPSTEATTTSSSSPTEVEQFDPETAQAEIAALLEEFVEFWTFDNETPDPSDPRLEKIFIGDQRERIRTLFEESEGKGQIASGTTTIRAYPPALLTPSNQTAVIGACRFGRVELLDPNGSILVPADDEAFEHSFDFRFIDGVWKIEAYGKSDGREIPCDI